MTVKKTTTTAAFCKISPTARQSGQLGDPKVAASELDSADAESSESESAELEEEVLEPLEVVG